jgi:signal transduction histidine kinase
MRSRSRFASRSSINHRGLGSALLVAALVASVAVAAAGFAVDEERLLAAGLAVAVLAAGALALSVLETERRRHLAAEQELAGEARLLEALVESIGTVTAPLDPDEILERARGEAERLFDARVVLLPPGETRRTAPADNAVVLPLRAHDEEVGVLRLARTRPFERGELVQATVLADFAARAHENALLLAEAQVREAERAQLSDQLITAEQEERRRLALFLHDTAVQSLSGIALLLDAGLQAMDAGDLDQARSVMTGALARHRKTIGELRDLSFALEPVVLRDQGFGPAIRALAEQIGLERELQIDVDVAAAEELAEKVQAALYQIIREALQGAVHRGPPSRISLRVGRTADGSFETVIADDAPGERRRRTFDAIAERARTVSGNLEVESDPDDTGTTIRVTLPPHAAKR